MKNLIALGWSDFFEKDFTSHKESGFSKARVITENKERYIIHNGTEELQAEVSGKLIYSSDSPSDFPKVGDWVTTIEYEEEKKAIIHSVLNRRSKFSRSVPGSKSMEQIIAANLDFIFIVQALDSNFNINRLQRYIVMAESGNVTPMVILNKSDLVENEDEFISLIHKHHPDVDVTAISASTGKGLQNLLSKLVKSKTYALVGSSGVGKSTIINNILGSNVQSVSEIRIKDNRGKHTTTRRELFIIPTGAILIDTPGMREFGLTEAQDGLQSTFSEIEKLSVNCRYSDCTHTVEKGCAVLDAVERGIISEKYFQNYLKLLKENEYHETKGNKDLMLERKRKEKQLHRLIKNYKHFKGGE
ncbi:MAG: ribosome small subunit-dependent GTPase A [Ignavibacteriales bacterium]|nr:MAG: ribosome small subunit-dependent GTPase A [Ignavibacteriales bacterium]